MESPQPPGEGRDQPLGGRIVLADRCILPRQALRKQPVGPPLAATAHDDRDRQVGAGPSHAAGLGDQPDRGAGRSQFEEAHPAIGVNQPPGMQVGSDLPGERCRPARNQRLDRLRSRRPSVSAHSQGILRSVTSGTKARLLNLISTRIPWSASMP